MPDRKHKRRSDPMEQKAVNAAIRKLRRKVFATDEGTVTSVTGKECAIEFGEGDSAFSRKFPTWRMRIANADEVGAKVRHTLSHFRGMVISRIVRTDKHGRFFKIEPLRRRLTTADFARLNRDSEPEPE